MHKRNSKELRADTGSGWYSRSEAEHLRKEPILKKNFYLHSTPTSQKPHILGEGIALAQWMINKFTDARGTHREGIFWGSRGAVHRKVSHCGTHWETIYGKVLQPGTWPEAPSVCVWGVPGDTTQKVPYSGSPCALLGLADRSCQNQKEPLHLLVPFFAFYGRCIKLCLMAKKCSHLGSRTVRVGWIRSEAIDWYLAHCSPTNLIS